MAESWRSGRSDKLVQKSGFITKDCESYRIGQLGLEAEICFTVDCSRAIGAPGPKPTFAGKMNVHCSFPEADIERGA